MVFQTTKDIEAAFKAQNWSYDIDEREGSSALITGFNLKSGSSVQVFFISAGDKDLAIRIFRLIAVPAGKQDAAIRVCNSMNQEYRYVKFVSDNENISAQLDVAIETANKGPVAVELLMRTLDIIDGALPTFRAALEPSPAVHSSPNSAERY